MHFQFISPPSGEFLVHGEATTNTSSEFRIIVSTATSICIAKGNSKGMTHSATAY